MPDSVKEIDIEVAKAEVHNKAKEAHRQVKAFLKL
jgi:hypothetical protein